ncbi:MAG: Asp-tRNA(Asn)/Glu-tRNA(Gln) amidotransferase subunit GatC, partial [Candidatus Angelobacter sp.]
MNITEQDVKRVAGLASIELTAAEGQTMARELGSILDYVGHLQELDTTHVAPLTQVTVQAVNTGPGCGTNFSYAQRADVV